MVPKPELHITKVLIPVTQLPSVLQDYVAKHFIFLYCTSHYVDFLSVSFLYVKEFLIVTPFGRRLRAPFFFVA